MYNSLTIRHPHHWIEYAHQHQKTPSKHSKMHRLIPQSSNILVKMLAILMLQFNKISRH